MGKADGKPKKVNKNRKPNGRMSGRRVAVVDALNKSIEIFASLEERTFDEVMTKGIRPVADAVGLDRVVFYTLVEKNGIKRFGQIYRWDRSEGGLMFLADELLILPSIPILENWISITSQGDSIRLRKSDYSEEAAAFLSTYGIKSILLVPIFTQGEFWGIISFQDHTNDRYFDEDCDDLLHSAARIFSGAIIRAEMAHNVEKAIDALKRREKMADTLNRVAIMFLSRSKESFEDTMTAGVKEIADTFNLDRFSIWRNMPLPDGLHAGQIYRWDRESGGTTVPTKGLENALYVNFAPRWEKLFSSGGAINSPVRLLPEADMLQSFGVVTAFVSPIFFNNIFWGFALLEDRHTERFFEADSVEMMRSAILLCVNTVMRADMEREIINANDFNRAILNTAPLGFTIFDKDANVIDCNDITLKTLGTTKEYYIEHFYEFSPEYQSDGVKSSDKAAEIIRQTINGEKLVLEWVNRSSTGELIPYEITMARTKYNGKYVAMEYQYDLRNIKNMEENIREQSKQLRVRLEQQELISEISRGFISSGDSEAHIKNALAKLGRYHNVSRVFIFAIDYKNKKTYPMYNWSIDGKPPTIINFNMYEHLTFCFPERLPDSSVVPVISCEDIAANPEEAFRPLLAVNVAAYVCAPLYVEGKLWGVILAEQVSEPRQWTKNEKLFVGLTASTLAGVIMRGIYNTMLNDALNKATEASKAKGEFLSHMSHEIRTPLNAIIGMTGIGKNANDLDKKNYAINRIEDASTHLLGVINDILDMSKIEANKLELSSIEFNFEKMVQRVVNIISFRIDQKQQTLATNIDNNIPRTLIGDDQRLAQVITNLLGNAIKFTPEKGVINLDANLETEENGLYTIKISVTDNGIGITAEQQKKLFQSFQQAESDTVRKYGGTGLGLAISKSIVEAMGGRIWVQSEAGKGSTFAFTIKAKRGEKHEAVGLPMDKSDISILIVDDDKIILEYFTGISKKIGIHCDTAENGAQALALLEQNGDYNIYFLDLNMPDIDGIKLARELKSRATVNCEVVLITGNEWNTDVEEAKKSGVDIFLSKPLFPSVIEGVINEHLGVLLHDKETDIARFTAGRRVLLAEDMEINREIITALLEPTQLEIECVDNGVRAVQAFENAPDRYDLIFMDIQMPEMDGYEATRYIRALNIPKAKTIPIIAMTANVFKEDIEKCLAAGMSGHVGKPINYKDVTGVLEKFLAPEPAFNH